METGKKLQKGNRGNVTQIHPSFEHQVRAVMATGCSARVAQDQCYLWGGFLLTDEAYKSFVEEMPSLRWLNLQREALGIESYLYTWLRVAGCENIIQWGFDETSLDGVPTLNQWAMLEDVTVGDDGVSTSSTSIVNMECAGLLVGSTAEEVTAHIELTWDRGKESGFLCSYISILFYYTSL
jgi:hypothetical protein